MRAAASKPQSGASRCWDSGAARAGTGVALLRVTLAACHGRPLRGDNGRVRPMQRHQRRPAAGAAGTGQTLVEAIGPAADSDAAPSTLTQ